MVSQLELTNPLSHVCPAITIHNCVCFQHIFRISFRENRIIPYSNNSLFSEDSYTDYCYIKKKKSLYKKA